MRSLGELDRRFLEAGLSWAKYEGPEELGCFRDEGLADTFSAGGLSSSLSPPIATDSGTSRNEDGCSLEGLADDCCGSGFGRPRAAAAQDSSVERLARRAAS